MTTTSRDAIIAKDNEHDTLQLVANVLQAGIQAHLIGPNGESVDLPASALTLLQQALPHLIQGDAVRIVSLQKELSTNEAADLLNVSRPYLIKLLDEGKIPFVKVGSHRRIRFSDVLLYKQHRDEQRRRGMEELVRLSEELGLYDY
jgi:excisionase family DNA binding protein